MSTMDDNTLYEDDENLEEEFSFLRYNAQQRKAQEEAIAEPMPTDQDDILTDIQKNGALLVMTLERAGSDPEVHSIGDMQIRVEQHYDLVQVDAVDVEANLEALWEVLSRYGQAMNSDVENGSVETNLTLVFVPENYSGAIVLAAANPIFWAACAADFRSKADRVRMMFYPDNIGIYSMDQDEEMSPPGMEFSDYSGYAEQESRKEEARRAYREKYGSTET